MLQKKKTKTKQKPNDKGKKCLKLTESTVRTFPFFLDCTKICLKISYFSFKKMRSVMYQNVSSAFASSFLFGRGCFIIFFSQKTRR